MQPTATKYLDNDVSGGPMVMAAADNGPFTPPDITGPFYRPGAPFRHGITNGLENATLNLTGRVTDDRGQVPANCYIEFWQASPSGQYDEAGPGYRGIQAVKGDGTYRLHTVVPGEYDISDPAAPEPHDFRCPHIHAKVWVNGKDVLTTQLYFPGQARNAADHWFDPRRVVKEDPHHQGEGVAAVFDFVVKRA